MSIGKKVATEFKKPDEFSQKVLSKINMNERVHFLKGVFWIIEDIPEIGRYSIPYCDRLNSEFTKLCYSLSVIGAKKDLNNTILKNSCDMYSSNRNLCYSLIY